MRQALLAGAVVALALVSASALGVEINAFPETTPLSPMSVVVSWTTDVPSDSLVEYGVGQLYNHSVHDPVFVTDHEVTVPLSETEVVYNFRVTSADGGLTEPDTGYDWYTNLPYLVTFQFPEEEEVVSGEVWLKGSPAQPRIEIMHAVFEVIPDATGVPVLVGEDFDGTDWTYGSEPMPFGDGWSTYWDTTGWPEGGYTARVTMNTGIGVYFGTRHIWLDHTPPTPEVVMPAFGQRCYGVVSVLANGAQGAQQVIFAEQQAPGIVNLATVAFKQSNYNWASHGKPSKGMCHPCTQASILWTNPAVRNYYTRNGSVSETRAKQMLVWNLASNKQTDAGGTSDTMAKEGSILVLSGLRENIPGFDWGYKEVQGPVDIKKLKKAVTEPAGKVMGVGVTLRGANGWGHTLAVSKVDDNEKKDKDGNPYYDVTFTNPATGQNETYPVSPNGTFSYGTVGTVTMGSGFQFTGTMPPSGGGDGASMSAAAGSGWQMIGIDTDPTDGWSMNWDTTGKPPGLYFLRAEATDSNGTTGFDITEVALPAQTTFAGAKSQPDGMPVDLTGNYAVTHVSQPNWWMEDTSRVFGIGVVGGCPSVVRDDVVIAVRGSMTTDGAERKIAAYDVTTSGGTFVIRPLGMPNRSLVGGDSGTGQAGISGHYGLNNVGTLIRTWGEVVEVDPAGGWFRIDDGSTYSNGIPVRPKVLLPAGASPPSPPLHVLVTGISSCEQEDADLKPLILIRTAGDMQEL